MKKLIKLTLDRDGNLYSDVYDIVGEDDAEYHFETGRGIAFMSRQRISEPFYHESDQWVLGYVSEEWDDVEMTLKLLRYAREQIAEELARNQRAYQAMMELSIELLK